MRWDISHFCILESLSKINELSAVPTCYKFVFHNTYILIYQKISVCISIPINIRIVMYNMYIFTHVTNNKANIFSDCLSVLQYTIHIPQDR